MPGLIPQLPRDEESEVAWSEKKTCPGVPGA